MPRAYRLTLGSKFSEGARLLWGKWASYERLETMRVDLGAHRGELSSVLYGDDIPRLPLLLAIRDRFGIDPELFLKPPTETFVPPAVEAAAAALRPASRAA